MNSLYEQFLVALHAVWHRRWLALGVAWALSLIGWLVVALIPNSYESSARIYISMQSILPAQIGITPADQQKAIDRVRDTLTSATNLEKVIRRTDLGLRATSDADVAEMVDKLRDQITIKALQDNLFKITTVSRVSGMSDAQNAKLARSVVQNLIDLFVEGNLAGGRTEMTQTLRFLDDQLAQREKDLEAAEAKRVAFEQKFLGLMPGQGSIGSRIDAARTEMDNIDQQLVAAQSSLSAVNGQLTGIAPTVAAPSITINTGGATSDGTTAGRIAALQGQIADGMAPRLDREASRYRLRARPDRPARGDRRSRAKGRRHRRDPAQPDVRHAEEHGGGARRHRRGAHRPSRPARFRPRPAD